MSDTEQDSEAHVPNYKPKRLELFNIWRELSGTSSEKCQYLQNVVSRQLAPENLSDYYLIQVRQSVYNFCARLSTKWQRCQRTENTFLQKNNEWLAMDFKFPAIAVNLPDIDLPSTSRSGRPKLSFEESSERSKRRKTKELVDKHDKEEITSAAQLTLKYAGDKDAAKLMKEALHTTPTRASKIAETWRKTDVAVPHTPDEALSLFVETKMTKNQYLQVRLGAKSRKANIYPSYHKMCTAKVQCYPKAESITISETFIEVELQALLDHTASRRIKTLEEVINCLPKELLSDLVLISKWGCDGSTGHSQYEQRSEGENLDKDMFIISFVPLLLHPASSKDTIIWQNPSSVRYCRPIKILFAKETTTLAQEEIAYVEEKIRQLEKTEVDISQNQKIKVGHELLLTMIDGKICNSVTSTTSAQKCYICGATPKQMNTINNSQQKKTDVTTYRFGLSTLHAWIRFFECLLHISYRLEFKKWQARKEDVNKLAIRKLDIQKKFREEMGLIVDQVQPIGAGTSNDGNTARRFFRNYMDSARITELNEELVRRFGVILQALSSGFHTDTSAFDKYCTDTFDLYIQEYSWYYMPASVYKVLVHGSDVIKHAILPIGKLSEEAQESRNKDLKHYRRDHTRKISRLATNEDLLHLLLVSSDPFITSLRPPPRTKNTLSAEAVELLTAPDIPGTSTADEIMEIHLDTHESSTSESDSSVQSDYESDY